MSDPKTITLPSHQWEAILRGLASSGWDSIHRTLSAALAEQGESEWEYAWNWSSHPYRDPLPLEGDAPERAAYLADIEQRIAPTVVFRRTREVPAGPWLPVPDTTNHKTTGENDA